MKKGTWGAALLLLSFLHSQAQQNPNLNFKYSVKVYNLSTYNKQSEVIRNGNSDTGFVTEHKELQALHPTVAFQLKNKKNNIHEIELTHLELGKQTDISSVSYNPGRPLIPLSGSKITTTHIALRYEYIRNFNKQRNSKFMPSLGLAVLPYYQREKYTPVMATNFPQSTTYVGLKGFVIPRLSYSVSEKLYVDLNVPVCAMDFYAQIDKNKNPTLPVKEQSNTTQNFELMPEFFSLRLGVGLRI